MNTWRDDTTTRLHALGRALRQPGPERDALLLLFKAAVAAVVAWQFALHVLHSSVPFYAPMAALLVVDRTMVRSLAASVQRIAAVVLGLGVAWVVALLVGITWWSMLAVLLVALVIGRWGRLGDHGIQVPAMVLLSFITVNGTDEQFTYLTIVETIAGGLIGVAVNAIVFAPLHLTKPRQRVAALARQVHDLLTEMADGLRGEWNHDSAQAWYRRGDAIADRAPLVIEDIHTGRESTRLNPRDNLRPADVDWEGYEHTVNALRRMLWQVTGIARTLVDAGDDAHQQPAPSPTFLHRYADALADMADAVEQLGLHGETADARFGDATRRALKVLEELREEVRTTPLADPEAWPVYGSLISDSTRAVRELQASYDVATVPTDSGPLRVARTSGRRRRRTS
ncbi:FUSC family protein [Terrabacter terrigena]|uniref:Aromatic acid exporter family protein n=1 Tax=Terrabacter terrigena TaxID=574718 RepID=A0ABW3MUF2_9MICO